jgi:ABC-2 type transport system permease protein
MMPTGTWLITRQALRRDRVLVAVWLLVLTATVAASAGATAMLYPTEADRVAAAEGINASPAIVALYGPVVDVTSLGELAMTKLTVLYAVFVAVLALVLVRRHTRTEEESGRAELVGGTAVARDAVLAAALLEAVLVVAVLGVLAAVADVAAGLPVVGSVAFGASWVGVGLVGAGVSAVACQLSASSRTCAAIAAGAIGLLFLLRAVGDTSVPWLGWLSPLGWSTRLHAWHGPRWGVLLLYAGLAGLLATVAVLLRARRDLGSGLVAARPGRAHGRPRLADAVALGVRLHTAALVTWTVAVAVMGLVLGSIAPDIGSMLDSPAAREMVGRLGGEGALERTLLAAELSIAAVVVTCFALAVVGHGGADERDGRTEQVLATATSRTRALAGTLLVALLGATWLLLATGVGTAIGYGTDLGAVVGAALAQAPAVWLVTALAAAAYALSSGWAWAGWALLVAFLTLGQLGELLRLPRWLVDASPYAHVPTMPVESFALAPAATMTGLAALVLAAAWWRFCSRDIG